MMMMMMMIMTVIIVRMEMMMMMMMMMKMRGRTRVKMMMMTCLKLLRSVVNSVFHFSYLRCRPPRTAFLDKKECRSITTHRSRSH